MCGCEKHNDESAPCTCICDSHRNFEAARDLAMRRYDAIVQMEQERTEWENDMLAILDPEGDHEDDVAQAELIAQGIQRIVKRAEAAERELAALKGAEYIDIVFSSVEIPSQGGPAQVFVEVENHLGEGVKLGEWVKRADGYHALRIAPPASLVGQAAAEKPVDPPQAEVDETLPPPLFD